MSNVIKQIQWETQTAQVWSPKTPLSFDSAVCSLIRLDFWAQYVSWHNMFVILNWIQLEVAETLDWSQTVDTVLGTVELTMVTFGTSLIFQFKKMSFEWLTEDTLPLTPMKQTCARVFPPILSPLPSHNYLWCDVSFLLFLCTSTLTNHSDHSCSEANLSLIFWNNFPQTKCHNKLYIDNRKQVI